jgi:hypothetical protein
MEVCLAITAGMAWDINPYAWLHVSDDIWRSKVAMNTMLEHTFNINK